MVLCASIVLLFALQRFATGLILAPPTFGFVRGQRAATRLCSQSLQVVHVSCSRAAPTARCRSHEQSRRLPLRRRQLGATADPVPVVSTPVEPEASREHKRSRPARSTPSHLEAGPIALSWAAGGLTLLLQHHFTDWTQAGADAAYLSQRLQDVGVGPLPQPDLQVALLWAYLYAMSVGVSFAMPGIVPAVPAPLSALDSPPIPWHDAHLPPQTIGAV